MSHIVHADNSEFFRKLMKTFLVELGHESTGFTRGEDAIALVNSGEADCVITGLELLDMGGEEFVKRLIGSRNTVPVIVVTSEDDAEQQKLLTTLGVKAVIQKSDDWKAELSRQLANIRR